MKGVLQKCWKLLIHISHNTCINMTKLLVHDSCPFDIFWHRRKGTHQLHIKHYNIKPCEIQLNCWCFLPCFNISSGKTWMSSRSLEKWQLIPERPTVDYHVFIVPPKRIKNHTNFAKSHQKSVPKQSHLKPQRKTTKKQSTHPRRLSRTSAGPRWQRPRRGSTSHAPGRWPTRLGQWRRWHGADGQEWSPRGSSVKELCWRGCFFFLFFFLEGGRGL